MVDSFKQDKTVKRLKRLFAAQKNVVSSAVLVLHSAVSFAVIDFLPDRRTINYSNYTLSFPLLSTKTTVLLLSASKLQTG